MIFPDDRKQLTQTMNSRQWDAIIDVVFAVY